MKKRIAVRRFLGVENAYLWSNNYGEGNMSELHKMLRRNMRRNNMNMRRKVKNGTTNRNKVSYRFFAFDFAK